MPAYEWRGLTTAGKKVRGVRDADSPKVLRQVLRRDGIMVTDVEVEFAGQSIHKRSINIKKFWDRTTVLDIALLTRQLATLLKSAIPLVEAITALSDQVEKPDLKRALVQVRDKVNEGSGFADALKLHPNLFSVLYVNMVAAGEASGTLEVVLGRLADFLEGQARLKSKVGGALAYPAFMALMGVVIIAVMMTVVVPKVTAIFEDFKQALPWYTRVLIFISRVFADYWWLLLILTVGGVWFFRRWLRTPHGRSRWDHWMITWPLIGKLNLMVAVSRFARTLSTLLAGGVPVLSAMEITRNVIENKELEEVVETARLSIREGESLAAPLKRSGKFPPLVTHMIAVGERSGQLEAMLDNVAVAFEGQVESRLTAMTSLLEPMMIVLMGGISGAIAFSILMPLMRINEFVQ